MIKRKICKNCHERIKGSPNFCPNCGIPLKNPNEEFGMLGKKDSINSPPKVFSGIGGKIVNKMIGSAMKMLEKEMQKNMNEIPQGRIKLMINGKEISPKKNRIQEKENDTTKILPINFSDENLKKWKKLKKAEPKSSIKRIENKIQYALKVPEVRSIKDVSIIKLENSLEVRAIGQKKAYKKTIPLNLPLKKYSLLKGFLTLEMDAR